MTGAQRKLVSLAVAGVSSALAWKASGKLEKAYGYNYRPSGLPKLRAAQALETPKDLAEFATHATLLFAFFAGDKRGDRALKIGKTLAGVTSVVSLAQQCLAQSYIESPKVEPIPSYRGPWDRRDSWCRAAR